MRQQAGHAAMPFRMRSLRPASIGHASPLSCNPCRCSFSPPAGDAGIVLVPVLPCGVLLPVLLLLEGELMIASWIHHYLRLHVLRQSLVVASKATRRAAEYMTLLTPGWVRVSGIGFAWARGQLGQASSNPVSMRHASAPSSRWPRHTARPRGSCCRSRWFCSAASEPLPQHHDVAHAACAPGAVHVRVLV